MEKIWPMAGFELSSVTSNANAIYYGDVFSKGKINIIHQFVLLSLLCFFNTFVFYWLCLYLSKNSISLIKNRALEKGKETVSIYVCHALSVENVCNEITARQVIMHRNHVLAKKQSHCAALALACVQLHTSPQIKKKEGMGQLYKGYPCRKTCRRLLQQPQAQFKNFFTDMVQGLL